MNGIRVKSEWEEYLHLMVRLKETNAYSADGNQNTNHKLWNENL